MTRKKERKKADRAEHDILQEVWEEEFATQFEEVMKKDKKKKMAHKNKPDDEEMHEMPMETGKEKKSRIRDDGADGAQYSRKNCMPEITTEPEDEEPHGDSGEKKKKKQENSDAEAQGAGEEAVDEACVRSPNQLALHDLKAVLVTPKFEGKAYSQPGHTLQEIQRRNASLKQRQLRLEELSAVQATPRTRPSALLGAWWF